MLPLYIYYVEYSYFNFKCKYFKRVNIVTFLTYLGSSNAVVAYMSIIASIGAIVVIGIAAWRNKEIIQKKLKKQKIRFPRLQRNTDDVSGKEKSKKTTSRKSENLYDDINEKYMIKDFKAFDRK